MPAHPPRIHLVFFVTIVIVLLGASLACKRALRPDDSASWQVPGGGISLPTVRPTHTPILPPTRPPGAPILTPTPDDPHTEPPPRTQAEQYQVQAGDTLGNIANQYDVSVELIIKANKIDNPNALAVGQVLTIPVPTPDAVGPDFKIIPDSELVYGPVSAYFDLKGFIAGQKGYLAQYREDVNDKNLASADIIQIVAQDYSVNPRLLLAVLQKQSQWVTNASPKENTLKDPLRLADPNRKGLYHGIAWVANNLNRGFYLWQVGGVSSWTLADGTIETIAPSINPATAGVQYLYAQLYGRKDWEQIVSKDGLYATYNSMYGYPFDLAIDPLLPLGLRQPALQLPFEPNVQWALTSGPHAGWDSGSAWAALDFAPYGEPLGCVSSDAWVVATSNGIILRADNGAVIQDLDYEDGTPADGLEQTGWIVLYMHIESRDRVKPGTYLHAGEHIGHPSCEGGISTGTHLHLARRYNGEWIPADQDLPFIMDGWVSHGTGTEYEGFLEKNGKSVQADASITTANIILR